MEFKINKYVQYPSICRKHWVFVLLLGSFYFFHCHLAHLVTKHIFICVWLLLFNNLTTMATLCVMDEHKVSYISFWQVCSYQRNKRSGLYSAMLFEKCCGYWLRSHTWSPNSLNLKTGSDAHLLCEPRQVFELLCKMRVLHGVLKILTLT